MYSFVPAVRLNTPLIIGVAGPTKSGKTYSAHRLAAGLAAGRPVAMINSEGPRGHQYAEKFKYVACELAPPYRPQAYMDALAAAVTLNPGCIIIDSNSHMHDGPGGLLEWHDEEVDKMLGDNKNDYKARQRMTFAGWVKPKKAENDFVYAVQAAPCPVILCLRAKEKLKVVPGKPPVDLGWQPIVGERVAFETIFTLMLPPHSQGVPDLTISDMREPFDTMITKGRKIDEALGKELAEWAKGGVPAPRLGTEPTITVPTDAAELLTVAESNAALGTDHLRQWFGKIGTIARTALKPHTDALREKAAKADAESGGEPRI